MNNELQSNYHGKAGRGKLRPAYRAMMKSLGKCLVKDKNEFVVLLNESNVPASENDSVAVLIDKYVDNICNNQKLMLGTSLLLQMKNETSSAEGNEDENIKQGYFVIRDYLSFDDDYSEIGGIVGSIADVVGKGAELGTKALEGSQKKKYGALDLATKKQETQAALIQAVMQQKQAQLEADKKREEQQQKTKRTVIIVSAVVVGLAAVSLTVFAIMRKKK
jgi:cobalamin biosynthesis Mg chelatase CobN